MRVIRELALAERIDLRFCDGRRAIIKGGEVLVIGSEPSTPSMASDGFDPRNPRLARHGMDAAPIPQDPPTDLHCRFYQ